jgi:two-component sensor histidine kinase/sugar lactone lactonase YvrE
VYIATSDKLWVIDEVSRTIEAISPLNSGSSSRGRVHITSITYSGKDNVYLGTEDGKILKFQFGQSDVKPVRGELVASTSASVSNLLFHLGYLWIGTSDGLYQFDAANGIIGDFNSRNSGLSNSHVTDLHRAEGFIWIGTYQGLDTVRFSPFRTYDRKNSGIFEDIQAFDQDIYGNLWIGTYNGLFLETRDGLAPKPLQHVKTISPQVMTVADKSGSIWLGFRQGGIQIIDAKTRDVSEPDILANKQLAVTKILHSSVGHTWIATYGNGLYRLSENSVESFLLDKKLNERHVTVLLELENRDLIIGTEKSTYRYDAEADEFRRINFDFGEQDTKIVVLSINQNSKGEIWIGTKDKGLYIWKPEHISSDHIPLKKSYGSSRLEHSSIYGIEFDSVGQAWVSTHDGIIKLGGNGEYIEHFDRSDGLQGNDFNFGASFKDVEGNIYFGGINGFNVFNPGVMSTDKKISNLLLTKIVYSNLEDINYLDMPDIDTIHLTHENYFITFEFSVLDFIDPENNQFRYKLENFDPDWIDIGHRNTATYTNLPAGDYVFRVQGANSAGVWNRDGISINVRMLPPPWLTWWAFVGYSIAATMLFWLIWRTTDSFMARRRTREMAVQMRENEERANDEIQEHFELHDDLINGAHEHNIATLSLIRAFLSQQRDYLIEEVSQNSVDKCAGIISTLSSLENCLFYHDDGLTADLHKFTDLRLSELLSHAEVDPESVITINDVVKERLPAELASPLAVFINEALQNSLQHAFEQGSPANYLQVSLDYHHGINLDSETNYTLVISDNGVGIPNNISPEERETLGFATLYAMAEILSGEIQISANTGTRISLTFSHVTRQ